MTSPAPLELDIRPLLARGEQPFDAIMSAADALSPGQALLLIAPFRPAPLYSVMAGRGFSVDDRAAPGGVWEVTFSPVEAAEEDAPLAAGSAEGAVLWPDAAVTLDLTGMTPPEPMVCILEALEGMDPGAVLFAALDREPVFLFPELQARGHEWVGNYSADGSAYRLMIRHGFNDE